ncbi:thymidylate synthase [Streptomyces phage Blueeyedbeauty]|uniref:ThyX-like thymidylate synthase n=1 Tax=Streptomyces phage Blueeyedbeauty TaxID=2250336 RepID=A0A345L1K6_9CAUD|nr:thymidylate synthase [Streptomyces phage Blueeyedbeauty]AXH49158.1 ThyX-like thymidylate synthase [Streptomyces phage Blueeyedbeauty]
MTDKIDVLDKGYVRHIKHMGDDLDPVNSAKVSFAKESAEFGEREARLLAFLQREEHSSVFRHSALTFEVYAPLFVARQWWKYAVASTHLEDQNGWNESSRRYVTEVPEFYVPLADEWRSAPENRKQGSGVPVDTETGDNFTWLLEAYLAKGENLYNDAMNAGICAEQARLFLPAYGLYVRWRWTVSLGAVTHFLHQRLEHDAQKEIQDYAKAVWELTHEHFPICMDTIKKS